MLGDDIKTGTPNQNAAGSLLRQYRRRLIRKRRLWRAFRKRRELSVISDNRAAVEPRSILCFTTLRNEAMRLPFFLDHYRRLGVEHFFVVDNGSDDGGDAMLAKQADVTLYKAMASYRASRFGVDWLNWLKWKHAPGHWVVVADADEALIYPNWETMDLRKLTHLLADQGHQQMGALMLDMYPKGPVDAQSYTPGQDPTEVLTHFDAYGYWVQRQPKLDALWLQGGPRARMFFSNAPDRAPTLNKIPLVHWRRPYAFMNSTHSALPSHLNHTWKVPISGVLLHSKFLPGTATRAMTEKSRDEHFRFGANYADYYESLTDNPDFWWTGATRYQGWEQLVELGLMTAPDW